MKNVIIRNLYAVGMHHWSGKRLEIGPIYYCRPEANEFDSNAIAILYEKMPSKKAAYLRREDAKVVKQFFNENYISSHCYLRAKAAPEKFSKRKGPMQNVSIGFRVSDSKTDELEKFCKDNLLVYRIF